MTNQLESRVPHQMKDIFFPSGKKVIQTDDIIASFEQSLAKMTSEKPGPACDKNGSHDTASLKSHDST